MSTLAIEARCEKVMSDLEKSEFICEQKDIELAAVQAELDKTEAALKWSQEWGEEIYERAWKAEAALEDCERELCVVKAELYQSQKKFSDVVRARRSVFPSSLADQDSDSGEDSPPRYRRVLGGGKMQLIPNAPFATKSYSYVDASKLFSGAVLPIPMRSLSSTSA